MKRKMLNKSRLVAIMCSFCLALTSFICATLLFNKSSDTFAEDGNVGFYTVQGASVRYGTEEAGLKFQTVVTKEQYDVWKSEYGANAKFEFHTIISYANLGIIAKDVVSTSEISKHDFNNGDFIYNGAILFDLENKSNQEVFEIYETEYKAESRVKISGDKIATIFADENSGARSLRSVALVNRINEMVAEESSLSQDETLALQQYTRNLNEIGEFVDLDDEDIVFESKNQFYSNYADETCGVILPVSKNISEKAKGYVGALTTSQNQFSIQNSLSKVEFKGVKDFLTIGESERFIVDDVENNKVYVSNVIDATEVFFNSNGVERMQEVFGIFAEEQLRNKNRKSRSITVVDDFGNSETKTFSIFGDDGYYALGEDIDFAGQTIVHDKLISNGYAGAPYGTPPKHLDFRIDRNGDGDYTDPDDFDVQRNGLALSGWIGFGGTFDGNGYTIKNFDMKTLSTYSETIGGLFGALAYGATVKNLGFTNVTRSGNVYHGTTAVLAGFAGYFDTWKSSKDFFSTLNGDDTSFATTIDNCYFHFDESVTKASVTGSGRMFARPYSIVTEAVQGSIQFTNCVFDTPSFEPVSVTDNYGGIGIIGNLTDIDGKPVLADDTSYSNCFVINQTTESGRITPMFQRQRGELSINGTWTLMTGTVQYEWGHDFDKNPPRYIGSESYEIYAENDATRLGISNGDKLLTKINDGAFSLEKVNINDPKINEFDERYNKTAYVYKGINRYEDYIDMLANNPDKNSSDAFDSNVWTATNGVMVWKGLEISSSEIQITHQPSVVLNRALALEASLFGQDITDDITIIDGEGYTVDNDNKEVTVNVTTPVTVRVSAFDGCFEGEVELISTAESTVPYVISANYAEVYGESDSYSVPYKTVDGNLVATDFTEIYKDAIGSADAVLSEVFIIKGGNKQPLQTISTSGKTYVDIDDPGREPVSSQLVLQGDKGGVVLTDATTVTAVIEDADGFDYINNDATTMAGSYYLAKDFDDRIDETIDWNATTNSKTSEIIKYNDADYGIGYSFGYTPALNANDVGELAFHGLFDGLGHTISNLQVEKHGLMGIYNAWQDGGAILRNVKFDNMSVSSVYWTGEYEIDETTGQKQKLGAISYQGYMVLGMSTYKAANTDVQTGHRVYIENVIINLKSGLTSSVEIVGHRDKAVMNNLVQGKFDFTDVIINMPVTAGSDKAGVYQGHGAGGSAFVFGLGTGTVDNRFPVLIITNQGGNIDNLVVINAPHPGTKRIPMITGTRNGTLNSFLVMYANDYDKYIGANGRSDVFGDTTVYSTALEALSNNAGGSQTSNAGWGQVQMPDGSKPFVIVSNVNSLADGATWVKRHATNTHSSMANTATSTTPPTIFLRMNNMNRYDTYEAYVGTGLTKQHGNWLVNADGTATWNPVA